MLKVLEVILNKSYYKLGFQNGKERHMRGYLQRVPSNWHKIL